MGTPRWVLAFGYDGAAFYGWARQPGLRTVEGEILRGLVRQGIVQSEEAPRLEVASRTDRGVSARQNALEVTASLEGRSLLRAMNGIAPEIFFVAAAPSPPGFRVRRADRRTYRYYEPAGGWDLEQWRATARAFAGRIDVRSFGRGLPTDSAAWRNIESVSVQRAGETFVVEARGPSFVWGMVRKIVGALRQVGRGRVSPAQLAAALAGEERVNFPLAEPERLLLWSVEYSFPWAVRWTGPNRHQRDWWRAKQDALVAGSAVLSALSEDFGPVGPDLPGRSD